MVYFAWVSLQAVQGKLTTSLISTLGNAKFFTACNDPSYSYIDGQCYKYLNITATTWDKAAIACNDNGGTLPIIAQSTTDGGQNDQWNVFQRWRYVTIL